MTFLLKEIAPTFGYIVITKEFILLTFTGTLPKLRKSPITIRFQRGVFSVLIPFFLSGPEINTCGDNSAIHENARFPPLSVQHEIKTYYSQAAQN
jgi:hypothetical protein